MHTVTIVGVGRVGGALSLALPADKYVIDNFAVRDRDRWLNKPVLQVNPALVTEFSELSRIDSDIVIIATQDTEIGTVVARLSDLVGPDTHVFHTSGSVSSSVLEPLRSRGCSIGSIHPLVSLSDPNLGAERLSGSYFCVEGDPEAVSMAEKIVNDLGGSPFTIDADKKALYHAAAVMACGHLVALLDVSIELISKCGPDPDFAKEILLPLVESTLRNMESLGIAKALTGTFARADIQTFERHLGSLSEYATTNVRDIYLLLGDRSLDLALERGVDPAAVGEIRDRISMAKS